MEGKNEPGAASRLVEAALSVLLPQACEAAAPRTWQTPAKEHLQLGLLGPEVLSPACASGVTFLSLQRIAAPGRRAGMALTVVAADSEMVR